MLQRIAQAAKNDASNPKTVQEKKLGGKSGQKRLTTEVRTEVHSEDKRLKKDSIVPPSTRPHRPVSKEAVTQAPLSYIADHSYSPSFPRGPLLPDAVQAAMKYPISTVGRPLSQDAVAAQAAVSRLCKTNMNLEARFEASAMRERELTKQLTVASQTANDFAAELKDRDKYDAELKAEMKRKDRGLETQCKKLTDAEAESKAAKEALQVSLKANSDLRLKIISFESDNVKLDKIVKRQAQELKDAAAEYQSLKEKSDGSQKLLDSSDELIREMIYFMWRDGDFSFLKEEEAKMLKYCEERLAKAQSEGAGTSGTDPASGPVLGTNQSDLNLGTSAELPTSSAALDPTSSSALSLPLSVIVSPTANVLPPPNLLDFPPISTFDTSDITMAELDSFLEDGAPGTTLGESVETHLEHMPDMLPTSSLPPGAPAIFTDSMRTSTDLDDDVIITGSKSAPVVSGSEMIGAMHGIIDLPLLTPKTEKASEHTSSSKAGKSGGTGHKSLKIQFPRKPKK